MKTLFLTTSNPSTSTTMILLKDRGCTVTGAGDLEEAICNLFAYEFDAILISLSAELALTAVKAIRNAKHRQPIVVVQNWIGQNAYQEDVKMLAAGADAVSENDARVIEAYLKAVYRRSFQAVDDLIHIGPLSLNIQRRMVFAYEKPLHLTKCEFQMMELLMKKDGATVTKEMFLAHLYQGRDEPELKIIDVFMCKIRKKLRAANADIIATVWGRGYRCEPALLEDTLSTESSASPSPIFKTTVLPSVA